MKVLFSSIDNENPGGKRGIHSIVKGLVRANNSLGNQSGMLIGLPLYRINNESPRLQEKLVHLYSHQYLANGVKTHRSLAKGGSGKKRVLIETVRQTMRKWRYFDVDPQTIPESRSSWLKDFSFILSVPYFYQYHGNAYTKVAAQSVKKAVKKHGIDLVVMGSPSRIRKKDLGGAKLVHFIHDIMPIELDSESIDNNLPVRFAKDFYSAVTESDLLIANSQDTAQKIYEIRPEANVHVLYGVAPPAQTDNSQSELRKLGLSPREYVLFVSSIEKRKNVQGLIESFIKVADQSNLKLVIVGSKGFGYKELMKTFKMLPGNVQERIIFTGYVSEAAKNQLYTHADMFISPGFYEGLGLGPAEAMAYGVPAIVSRRGALAEIYEDSVVYIDDPYNTDEMADRILELHSNETLRQEKIEKGKDLHKNFTQEILNERFEAATRELYSLDGGSR